MGEKKAYFITALILFLASLTASMAVITYTDIHTTVKYVTTNEIVPSQPVELIFVNVNTGTTINLTEYTSPEGKFDYRLSVGNWRLIVKLDKPLTPEIDYSAERSFLIEENNPETYETIYIVPVGAVEGNVINPSGKLVSNADLTFKCKSYITISKTDHYGSFKQGLLPVGQCKVQAASDDFMGYSIVETKQGELTSTVIRLNKTLFSSTKNYLYIALGVVVITGLAFVVYRFVKKGWKRKDKKEKQAPEKKRKRAKAVAAKEKKVAEEKKPEESGKAGKEELNPRARDIIKTLNDKEKKVVEFLLSQEGYKSTQATIRNDTAIPKTTLIRVFQSLEAKKVIKVEVIGKLKKIELTEWFLGKG